MRLTKSTPLYAVFPVAGVRERRAEEQVRRCVHSRQQRCACSHVAMRSSAKVLACLRSSPLYSALHQHRQVSARAHCRWAAAPLRGYLSPSRGALAAASPSSQAVRACSRSAHLGLSAPLRGFPAVGAGWSSPCAFAEHRCALPCQSCSVLSRQSPSPSPRRLLSLSRGPPSAEKARHRPRASPSLAPMSCRAPHRLWVGWRCP